MPSKNPRKRPEPWQVILEEIRSQNRATIEAVEVTREVLEGKMAGLEARIDRLEHETRARDAGLELAIRELRADVRQVQGDVKILQGDVTILQGDVTILQGDVRGLSAKVETLAHFEERLTAIEKRFA